MTDVSGDQAAAPAVEEERISEEEFLEKKPRLRLRLHHFFALTAVMAVFMAISGSQMQYAYANSPFPESFRGMQAVLSTIYQIPTAVAVTALGFGIAAYRRGELFFNQPGDWLLVEISAVALISLPMAFMAYWMQPYSAPATTGRPPGLPSMVPIIIFTLYSLLVLVLGRILLNVYLARKCHQPRWKRVFYAKAAATILVVISDILIIVFLVMAMRTDRDERLLRSASHRCGVYVQLAQSLMIILTAVFTIGGMMIYMFLR